MRRAHMSTFSLQSSRGPASGVSPWRGLVHDAARDLLDLALEWHERARSRHQLEGLSDRMLQDIGLTRAQVEVETDKPFWRL
jgi:uncharacterized protein YjiS (DUF1127 family)